MSDYGLSAPFKAHRIKDRLGWQKPLKPIDCDCVPGVQTNFFPLREMFDERGNVILAIKLLSDCSRQLRQLIPSRRAAVLRKYPDKLRALTKHNRVRSSTARRAHHAEFKIPLWKKRICGRGSKCLTDIYPINFAARTFVLSHCIRKSLLIVWALLRDGSSTYSSKGADFVRQPLRRFRDRHLGPHDRQTCEQYQQPNANHFVKRKSHQTLNQQML